MPTKPTTSVLIVSYNTLDLTVACLESVYAQTTGNDFEVIVVDNASTDGSADAIARKFPRVNLVRSERNLGFARANNVAARYATGEYLLLLNPDTIILDNAIGRVVGFAANHPQAGIVGGRTYFEDGSLNPTSCHGRPTPWSLFCIASGLGAIFRGSSWFDPESLGAWKRDTVRQVDAVTGCFLLIRRALWEELGGFDESFFMYGEETDLCLRARAKGHICMICPDAKLVHYGGRSEKIRADKMVKLFAAKSRLFQKHWKPGAAGLGVALLDLWALSRSIAFGILSHVSPRHDESRDTWNTIWHRRGEWRLPPQGPPAGLTPAMGSKP